jgi:4-aminobutyrate aminotransferase-like enzyme
LATLKVIDEERLLERTIEMGEFLQSRLRDLQAKHSLIKEVRGRGLMVAIEFHEPRELAMRMGWKLLHKMEPELFGQMLVTALFVKHRVLTHVAGHGMDVIKLIPPLIIGREEVEKFVSALDSVLDECRSFPGPLWDLGANFVRHSLKKSPGIVAPVATEP